MPKSLLDRWPLVAAHPQASVWLKIQSDLGLAQSTLDAYGRALDDFLSMCAREQVDPDAAGRAEIARYVRHLMLFELQAWLGHRSPRSTQHHVKLTPLTLAKAYTDAGYFARNIRAIEVLIDRDAVRSGAIASGSPWQYFDVGQGYCTYSFFEQCPHRMACPCCDFYVPKGSSKAQLLEAKANLQRMLVEIPLTEEERAAVEDGQIAFDRLLERLAAVPTPSGPTPRVLKRLPALQSLDQPEVPSE